MLQGAGKLLRFFILIAFSRLIRRLFIFFLFLIPCHIIVTALPRLCHKLCGNGMILLYPGKAIGRYCPHGLPIHIYRIDHITVFGHDHIGHSGAFGNGTLSLRHNLPVCGRYGSCYGIGFRLRFLKGCQKKHISGNILNGIFRTGTEHIAIFRP